ncbi:MAG TPA: alpha/beta fold hydrolase [Candidatus Saccharimonadales bacterium]|nr:alpha/beta fold hydrolase [Candidatus Saccharimonadales bacterium]
MKRAVIIHCWGGSSNYAWYPWLKGELEKQGYQVYVPDMPNTDGPKLIEWLPKLEEVIGEPDDELLLVGHSLGTVTIMRYLESLSTEQRIRKVIFVAGFTDQLGFSELENFFETRLDFASIKSKAKGGFVIIQSDDDPFVSEQYGTRLKEELDAKLVIKHAAKHMSGAVDGEGACTELPEVIQNL